MVEFLDSNSFAPYPVLCGISSSTQMVEFLHDTCEVTLVVRIRIALDSFKLKIGMVAV